MLICQALYFQDNALVTEAEVGVDMTSNDVKDLCLDK